VTKVSLFSLFWKLLANRPRALFPQLTPLLDAKALHVLINNTITIKSEYFCNYTF